MAMTLMMKIIMMMLKNEMGWPLTEEMANG